MKSTIQDLKILFSDFWKSKAIRRIILLISLAVGILFMNVIGELRMNQWQGEFFRAIENKKLAEVGRQAEFFLIMIVLFI